MTQNDEIKIRQKGSQKENREIRRLLAKRNAAKKRGDTAAAEVYGEKLNKEYQWNLRFKGYIIRNIPYRPPTCKSHASLQSGDKCPICGFAKIKF